MAQRQHVAPVARNYQFHITGNGRCQNGIVLGIRRPLCNRNPSEYGRAPVDRGNHLCRFIQIYEFS